MLTFQPNGRQRAGHEADAGSIVRVPVLLQDLLGHVVQHAAALYAGHLLRPRPGSQQRRHCAAPPHHQHMRAFILVDLASEHPVVFACATMA